MVDALYLVSLGHDDIVAAPTREEGTTADGLGNSSSSAALTKLDRAGFRRCTDYGSPHPADRCGMLLGVSRPDWWRGETPSGAPRGVPGPGLVSGAVEELPWVEIDPVSGLRRRYFFSAAVSDTFLCLDNVGLTVEWSEFTNVHFRQKNRPITNELGLSAQGSFGNSPAYYRNCVFEGVRFKQLGGFTLSRGWFEGCKFINCRWEGHFAMSASLVDCSFSGRMNGCAWFGDSERGPNIHRGNDYSAVQFTDNVAWRYSFPVADQKWPEGYVPLLDG